jgi:hypothetical protein
VELHGVHFVEEQDPDGFTGAIRAFLGSLDNHRA